MLKHILLIAAFAFAAPAFAAESYPIITRLEMRGKMITIMKGPDGPLYTVKSAKGEVLADGLGEKDFRAQLPELFRVIKTALVGGDSEFKGYLDGTNSVSRPFYLH